MVNDISVLRCILELTIAFRNNLQAAVTHARRATVGADKVATHGNIPVGALLPVAVGRAVTKGTRAHSLALLQRIVGPYGVVSRHADVAAFANGGRGL